MQSINIELFEHCSHCLHFNCKISIFSFNNTRKAVDFIDQTISAMRHIFKVKLLRQRNEF